MWILSIIESIILLCSLSIKKSNIDISNENHWLVVSTYPKTFTCMLIALLVSTSVKCLCLVDEIDWFRRHRAECPDLPRLATEGWLPCVWKEMPKLVTSHLWAPLHDCTGAVSGPRSLRSRSKADSPQWVGSALASPPANQTSQLLTRVRISAVQCGLASYFGNGFLKLGFRSVSYP